jgi:hypothetical protein
MSCQQIVPMTIWDVAAGLDRCNQGLNKAIKTADGTYWAPANLTPMEAAATGLTLGYVRGDRVCSR